MMTVMGVAAKTTARMKAKMRAKITLLKVTSKKNLLLQGLQLEERQKTLYFR
jgi:hypothetical protein